MKNFFNRKVNGNNQVLRLDWLAGLAPVALLLTALVVRVFEPPLVTQLRLAVFDQYQVIKPRQQTALPVRLLDIDEESLHRLGQWPWPRDQLARLVDLATEAGAAAVVLDILLSEPDRLSPAEIARLLPERPEYNAAREDLAGRPGYDEVLAAALARSNAVLGFALTQEGSVEAPELKAGLVQAGDAPNPFLLSFARNVAALPVLAANAAGYGVLSLVPDSDGVVRRAPLFVTVGNKVVPTIDAEALRVAQGASTYIIKSTNASGEASFGSAGGVVGARIGALAVPTDRKGRMWIRYARESAPSVAAWQLLAGATDPQALAGQIVLLGSTAAGLSHPQSTPLAGAAPALAIHGQILETLISENFLYRPDWAEGAEIILPLVLGLILIWLLPRWGALWCAFIALAAIVAAVEGSWILFSQHNALVDPLYFGLVIVLVYLTQSLRIYLSSERERREVRGAFSRYLSPALVEQLANEPGRLRLGGETRQMTILFCDIRGFTSISERHAPEELTRLINRFLTPLTQAILDRQGTIDKYMGDCIMAFWNAPLDVPDHAGQACRAALAMLEALDQLNGELASEAARAGHLSDDLKIGVGINSGTTLVGNLGSEQRFDYSILGDSVNLASRLEGQSKAYCVDVLITEETFKMTPGMAALELDLVQVVGKSEPVRIFTLLGDEAIARSDEFKRMQLTQDGMLRAYRARDWIGALHEIDQMEQLGFDMVQRYLTMFRERIAEFQATPPGPDWDGVERRLVK
ncbi:MAG: adenylate/guanylate cyclase domain-containing protein [Arenicellales bacterium]|nr:adenylate/guanylate cyclase domain-containing protein [Arenicellales bacterium]